MKQPRIPKKYATAEMFDIWREVRAGSGDYHRTDGSGSFSRIWHDYASAQDAPAWIITARMKATDTPSLDNVVARGE